MAYAFTFWTCFVLMKEYEKVANLLLNFLSSEKRRRDQFTVLVRNIPPDPDESVTELVEHFFMVNHLDQYLTDKTWCSDVYGSYSWSLCFYSICYEI
ncbi:protein OSCA1-like isoform X2 [Euphorbia lathyris]|uniref:protein OSCA1-like isoform X2 n=1 Tax=Euphorbia lathyris TaxID=212925 RepID=UPI003313AD7A